MSRSATARAVDGALALAAAMGIGRFAYTALLPATQRALGVGDDVAGALASANLVGYLAGVLQARRVAGGPECRGWLRAGIGTTAIATALGAATTSVWAWAALRFAAGVASGLVFVLASAAALEGAARSGLLYAGVGIGIALSGVVSALIPPAAGHALPWLLLGAAAAALGARAWLRLGTPPVSGGTASAAAGPPTLTIGLLGAAYFLEGLGYIVSGTFAVAAVRRTPGLEGLAAWTWVLTGLAAAPSALLWADAGQRFGTRGALTLAYLVQAIGMALPSLSRSAAAALGGSALFGSTFLGIVALTMSAARGLSPGAPGRAVGTLTALYGVGQILGPLLAGAASQRMGGDPRPAALGAAVAVAIGGALLGFARERG
jgi:MFS family permease